MKLRILGIAGLGLTLVAGALLPYGSLGNAHASAPLASLALKKSDVPAGFKQTVGKSQTIQEWAASDKVSVATVRSKGWVGTYESNFQKSAGATATQIDSGIDQFKSQSGAKWDLTNGLRILRKELPAAKTFSVQGIGDQAFGLKASGKNGNVAYSLVFVFFRRGSYLSGAGISVSKGTASTSDTERYAKLIDGRIKNA